MARPPKDPPRGRGRPERVYEMFPRLAEPRRTWAHWLSGGEQQMLAVGRALVLNLRLLLLDEPLEGPAPIIVEELLRAITASRGEEGLSAIIVEQHPAILAISDHAAVLDRGTVVHTGSAAELLSRAAGPPAGRENVSAHHGRQRHAPQNHPGLAGSAVRRCSQRAGRLSSRPPRIVIANAAARPIIWRRARWAKIAGRWG